MATIGGFLANASTASQTWPLDNEWNSSISSDYGFSNSSNGTSGLPYEQTPAAIRQYMLIARLALLGIGTFDTLLLLLVYVRCANIITTCLGVYVANIALATLLDMADIGVWALREFGIHPEHIQRLPWWAYRIPTMAQAGLPTASLLLLLLLVDRLFATCFFRCHRSCYGFKPAAAILSIAIWAGSGFLTFALVYRDILFPHDPLYEQLRFAISYVGPFALKLILAIGLFAKRHIVPNSEQSQAMIYRQRVSLYYALTIVTVHVLLSAPYYAVQANHYCAIVRSIRIDAWIELLLYTLSELPLVLNPLLCFAIEPEFRDSLVYFCTCAGRGRRELSDLCDDHAESQPLAPMAISPCAEEKDHLDEADA